MPRTHRRSIAWRLWLGAAAALTLVTVSGGGMFSYYYADEAVGPRVVCLMYHKIVTAREFDSCEGDERYYSIPVNRFEEHLRYLRTRGYQSLGTDDCIAYLKDGRAVPEKSVFITIDDGYESALTRAQPLLRKYGFRATLFVTADPHACVFDHGRPRQPRLSDQEMQRLDASVIDVQAHGLTHRPLNELPDDELLAELTRSRDQLGAITHRSIRCMAVPGNHYDERVLEFAKRAGYQAVFTSDPGSLDPGDDLIGIPRVNVAGYFDAPGLASILDADGMARRRFVRTLSAGPVQLLGTTFGRPLSRFLCIIFAKHPPNHQAVILGLAGLFVVWTVTIMVRRRVHCTVRSD